MPKKEDLKAIVLNNISALAGEKRWGRVTSFAKEVGISTKLARDILEKGTMPKIETLQKIASTYSISLDALLKSKQKKPEIDPVTIEMIVLQKKAIEVAKKDPLFKRNYTEGLKVHLEMNEKKLEHEFTGIVDVTWAMSRRIYGRKKTRNTK
jgi:transcriptional regulator with XRE-family HTH domain